MSKLKSKKTSYNKNGSEVMMTEFVLPSHTNAHGTIFGGVVMSWIDIAGAVSASRYSRSPVVTVSIDYLHFMVPIKTGFIVEILSRVSFVGKTSMEVEAKVIAEHPVTGERRESTRAFLTFVAIDEHGRARTVPVMPEPKSKEEKEAYKQALIRRKRRLEQMKS